MACHYKPYHLHYAETAVELDPASITKLTQNKSALIIVDVQKDFLPGGSMSILNRHADAAFKVKMMIANINDLIKSGKFDYHIYVQDSHPEKHVTFASSHKDCAPFQIITEAVEVVDTPLDLYPDMGGVAVMSGMHSASIPVQMSMPMFYPLTPVTYPFLPVDPLNPGVQLVEFLTYPEHCRQPICSTSSCGIEFAADLLVPSSFADDCCNPCNKCVDADLNKILEAKSFVLNVGETKETESFSAFKNYYAKETGLCKSLIDKGITKIYVCGVALDFGVWWAAADASSYRIRPASAAAASTTASTGTGTTPTALPGMLAKLFDVSVVWDASLPVPSSTSTAEYGTDPSIKSKHNEVLRTKYKTEVQSVFDGLMKTDPRSNRWVEVFLQPYSIKASSTADLL